MAIRWEAEACDLDPDPQSGAPIARLTAAVMSNINIYCEQPYASADGRRIAYARCSGPDPRVPPFELRVADLVTLKTACIEPLVVSNWVATSSWSGLIYYLRENGELIRVDLQTLEKEIVITHWELPSHFGLQSVSPDHRYLFGVLRRPEFACSIVRVDLQTHEWMPIFDHDEVLSHLQVDFAGGEDLLVQLNRGTRIDHLGRRKHVPGAETTATHFLIDLDGDNLRWLPVGPPHTAGSCGHAAWIAGGSRIGLAVQWRGMTVRKEELTEPLHDARHPEGNFVIAGPEDESPRIFEAPDHLFNHVNVSRCGRYFVCDSYRNGIPGPIELVVGNMDTGKYRTLVSDCGAQGGGPACSHPHPYFTADNGHVIYNADPTLICHVHKARVTEEFLSELEA